jgi:SNF2 family DNA or RNA helicase
LRKGKSRVLMHNNAKRIQLDAEDGHLGVVDVFLTTYTTVINDADRKWLQKRKAEYLVVDEAHEIRNSDSLRHKV